ncbi:MAG: CRISPR-associated ring nuclease [Chloroflexi bacterium]|nr:CRISPR-associated ring nuclease [Chloroflexota bacterium]
MSQGVSFIATLGVRPQIVTTAVDLLLEHLRVPHFEEIVVVHTLGDQTRLDDPMTAAVATLRQHLPDYVSAGFARSFEFVPLFGKDGHPLADVTTPQDADAMFAIIRRVLFHRKRLGREVHLCVAGGRKGLLACTMVVANMHLRSPDALWLTYSDEKYLRSGALHPQHDGDARLLQMPLYHFLEDDEKSRSRLRDFLDNSLTSRERDLVEVLVRNRLTNREAALRLGISEKRVEKHLSEGVYPALRRFLGRGQVGRQDLMAEFAAYFK